MKRLIISAPFGNYVKREDATSTLGTFTVENRGGFWLRLWRFLATVRYQWRSQSWINRMRLPNPGIFSVSLDGTEDKIVSIHGFSKYEWDRLAFYLIGSEKPLAIELNLSCPNVKHKHVIDDVISAVGTLKSVGMNVIAKLPPVRWFDLAKPLLDAGVRTFHLCNTIPTPGGGWSGKPLKQYSLWAIDEFRQRWGNTVILIGGGGVTSHKDVYEYLDGGADHVAIGSMLLNPFNLRKLKFMAACAESYVPPHRRSVVLQ